MELTVNYNFPRPNRDADPAQHVDEAFDAVATSLDMIDSKFSEHAAGIAGKAATVHGHTIADVTGLQGALDGKMAASATFELGDLTDTEGIGEAPEGYILAFTGGVWTPVSPAAAIGSHGHVMGDITGLSAALDERLEKAENLDDLPDKEAALATLLAGGGDALEELKWLSLPVGGFYDGDDGTPGVDIPPTDSPLYRYVLLTAGEDGVGEYNFGILTSESVSGSSPEVSATAVIDLDGSPMDGQTIRLLNTERRFLRAGSAGTLQDSQNDAHTHTGDADNGGSHTHTASSNSTGAHTHSVSIDGIGALPTGAVSGINTHRSDVANTNLTAASAGAHSHTITVNSTNSNHSHTLSIDSAGGDESRPRNIGVRLFRRIK